MDETKSLADANQNNFVDSKENIDNKEKIIENKADNTLNKESKENPQEVKQEVKQENKIVDTNTNQNIEKPKVKKRRFHLYHVKNAFKKAHPYHIKAKLEHYRFEYSRILHLARKPTKQEFKELSIMVVIGTFIIGLLGFVIQMIIQYI